MSVGSKAAWKTRAASSGAAANEPRSGLGELLALTAVDSKAEFLLSSKSSFDEAPRQVKIATQQIGCN